MMNPLLPGEPAAAAPRGQARRAFPTGDAQNRAISGVVHSPDSW